MIQYLRTSARSMLCEGLSRLPPSPIPKMKESNNNNSSGESGSERAHSPDTEHTQQGSRTEAGRSYSSSSDQRRSNHENSRDDHKKERLDRSKYCDDRHSRTSDDKTRRSSHDDRRRDSDPRDGKDVRKSREEERRCREEDRRKERSTSRSNKEDKSDDKEKSDKDHHHRDERRDRDRRRHRDRDRRHPREDRGKDRHREERPTYHKEKERVRSRSRSQPRDHPPPPFRAMSYREEKSRNKLAQLEKLGIELKAPEGDNTAANVQTEQNFYNPLATATQGKYAEQIQKRKLLWANKSKPEEGKSTSSAAGTANTWVGTTFTHDQDGKVTAKFKRLMGIKGDLPVSVPAAGAKPEILKKQEEMFSNMEQQYEVARATTHTQRGVGFGYATGGYQFPR
ncbi:arginine/serine-rich coiled-coil protein 2-like isoform X2 [Athalia rosae]|uniref:arginine/serine-rich coiled-coil protein 2-like isoform X2 n=2 Tax=Athalia rosae TaxID=37344 RepID=UPI002033513E|nr:arginine/serine-rich coiled-coil protein 2-like isoform X2 [Athalia rosae]